MATQIKAQEAPLKLADIPRGLYFGGAWHGGSADYVETLNPATGENLGKVAWAGTQEVDAAVAAARAGFASWRHLTPVERAKCLRAAAAKIREHGEALAYADAANTGNPFREMINDVEVAAGGLDYFAGLATELKGETHPMGPSMLNYTVREPLGVVVRINAYNHPFMFAAMRLGAPLAAGNAVIIKPPEQAPLSSLLLAELIGPLFPPGVVNVICGGRTCGEALVRHAGVNKIGLIGSVPTGRAILKTAADGIKPVSLELGGKNALIAFADADPDAVAAGLVRGMNFTWAGQSCGSTSRAFLHETLHDAVLERVADALKGLKMGLPTDPGTGMGCLVSQAQFDKVLGYIEAGRQEGARLVTGGKRPEAPELARGFFVEPTVFADVTADMRIAREEIFGPVLSVFRWSDEAEMLSTVNDVDYGLTASIWTKDLVRAHRIASAVEAGYVWVNGSSRHFLGAPFGGYKMSGIGREESFEELLDNSQIKNVNINLG